MSKDKLIIAKQKELITKLQSMVDSGQDYDRDYHEIWVELQTLERNQDNQRDNLSRSSVCLNPSDAEREKADMQTVEEILKYLKEFNPYPKSIFIPISDGKMDVIVKLLKDNGYSPDCLFGNWGRNVWNNCVEKLSNYVYEMKGDK